jgi:hypothetical protein
VDLSKLTTSDKVILGSAIAYLIFMFFPWYGFDAGGASANNSGWDYFLGGILPLFLGVAMALAVYLTRFQPTVDLPTPGPLSWGQTYLAAGVAAAVIVLLRVLIVSDVETFGVSIDLERKFGLYLAFLAALGLAAGGFLKFQEEKKGAAPAGPGSDAGPGTTPPTPF